MLQLLPPQLRLLTRPHAEEKKIVAEDTDKKKNVVGVNKKIDTGKVVASFLLGSKAYADDTSSSVHIVLQNSFAVSMLDKDSVRKTIAALIYSETGIKLTPGDIVFKSAETKDNKNEYIDELIDQDQVQERS